MFIKDSTALSYKNYVGWSNCFIIAILFYIDDIVYENNDWENVVPVSPGNLLEI